MSTFKNFARTVHAHPAAINRPRSVTELSQYLQQAAARHQPVRTVGAGHSFTPLVHTDGVLLNLDGFQGIEEVDAFTHEVLFRAGTRLWQVPALLKPFHLALENMGDIDRQSIAGAISTGTHGTGLKFTGLSAAVTGVQIMLADGSHVRASSQENPELFEASRLGLGALGVLTHVRMRCVPHFMIHAAESIEPIGQIAESFMDRARHEDHLEFFWFPGTSKAQVKINTRLDGQSPAKKPNPVAQWLNDELLSNGALQLLSSVSAAVPGSTAKLNAVACAALSDRSSIAPWSEAFTSPRRVRFTEMEYALPLDAFAEAFTRVRGYFERNGVEVFFPIEVRTAAADSTWLGTATGRDSVYIAVHRYIRDQAPGYFAAMEEIFRSLGGRPHWGKEHSLQAAELAQLFPKFSDFTRLRETLDPQGLFLNPYLRELLGA
ncbi:MAG: D-arabinono-1,4-lactone oxidase [Glutamicibacter arilaitensis]